jgi:hypothetical protein
LNIKPVTRGRFLDISTATYSVFLNIRSYTCNCSFRISCLRQRFWGVRPKICSRLLDIGLEIRSRLLDIGLEIRSKHLDIGPGMRSRLLDIRPEICRRLLDTCSIGKRALALTFAASS